MLETTPTIDLLQKIETEMHRTKDRVSVELLSSNGNSELAQIHDEIDEIIKNIRAELNLHLFNEAKDAS